MFNFGKSNAPEGAYKGRSGIDSYNRTTTFSERATIKGSLTVTISKCPSCNHHKALETANLRKCSKCQHHY